VPATVQNWSEDGLSFSLILPSKDNPLVDFVELPERYADLNMCALLAGVIRGALEMVLYILFPTRLICLSILYLQIQVRTETSIIKDSLKGDDYTEIRVVRKGILREEFNPDDE
jgi:hypothetical protein